MFAAVVPIPHPGWTYAAFAVVLLIIFGALALAIHRSGGGPEDIPGPRRPDRDDR